MSGMEEIAEKYYESIYNYCYRHTGNRDTAQDLTQETFLRMAKSRRRQSVSLILHICLKTKSPRRTAAFMQAMTHIISTLRRLAISPTFGAECLKCFRNIKCKTR